MIRRATATIYWPGISRDVMQMADNCVSCQEMKPANQKETLLQHDIGTTSGQKSVVISYFSNFIEVDHLTTTTSSRVVSCLRKMCARFGRHKQLVSEIHNSRQPRLKLTKVNYHYCSKTCVISI